MSKQSGETPEIIDRNKSKSKKRFGKYELWSRINPKSLETNDLWHRIGLTKWYKIRTYDTLAMAQQNLLNRKRKYSSSWDFEIRTKK